MDEKPISTKEADFERFSKGTSGAPTAVYWLTFALSVVFVGIFWFLGFNTDNALDEKKQEKDQITALLSSPDIIEVEDQAMNFRSVVSQLSEISTARVEKNKLLEDIFENFTKDIRISALSMSSEGELSMDGVAPSYKSVGELIMALKENDRISNVQLGTVSLVSGDTATNENVNFSLISDIDLSKDLTENMEGTSEEE